MNDIFDLYQELIIDHSRSPKNRGVLAAKTHHAFGTNPLCGDAINLELLIHDNQIIDCAFRGEGCAIANASASLMTENIKGKNLEAVLELFSSFHAMLVGDSSSTESLGKLEAFRGVRNYPIRVKCATLCWHTLCAALERRDSPVTTE